MKKILPFVFILFLCVSCSIDDDPAVTLSSHPEYIYIPKEIEFEVIYESDWHTPGGPIHGNLFGLNSQIINSQSEWDEVYNSITTPGSISPLFPPQSIDFEQYLVIFLSAEWDCSSCDVWIENVIEYQDNIEVKIDGSIGSVTFFGGYQNIYFAKIPRSEKPIDIIE